MFAVFVCIANIMVLIGGKHRMKQLPNVVIQQPEKLPAVNFNGSSVMMDVPAKGGKSGTNKEAVDLTKVAVKNPLWLSVVDINKFFDPAKVLVLGRKRDKRGYIVIGIPTVHRDRAYYLADTVKWLVINLPHQHRDKVIIVVFIADFDPVYRNKVANDIKNKFPAATTDGLIQVIQCHKEYYPNLDNLPLLYGDKPNRVKWRSKQSLDYSFLYYYCADLAEYYIQLEDDVLVEEGYFSKIEKFLESKRNERWSTIEFGARGFIGMTYRTINLPSLAKFFPILLLDHAYRLDLPRVQ